MTAPTPTPLERALSLLPPEHTFRNGVPRIAAPFIEALGAALLRQDERLAEVERERDEWQDAANDYHSLAVRFQASQARVAKLRAALLAVERPTDDGETCAICGCVESVGHVPDCIVGRALADTAAPEARPAGDDARASELRHAMNRRQR